MEFIKPPEIASKIISLIAEADKKLVIISPYNNFTNWSKVLKHLNAAVDRGIEVKYFVRKGETHKGFEKTKIKPIEVENLHAKLYINEKYAIISSMNILEASDRNSLDIALLINDGELYQKVNEFYKRYILNEPNLAEPQATNVPIEDLQTLYRQDRFFEEFYFKPAHTLYDFYINTEYHKEYHPGTLFMKEYGPLKDNKSKHGQWFEFNENGLLKYVIHYENGRTVQRDLIEYNKSTSLYWIMASLANIVQGLYRSSTKDLYFNSYIDDYIKDNRIILYDYVQNKLGIKLHLFTHAEFDYLADDIKKALYLKSRF